MSTKKIVTLEEWRTSNIPNTNFSFADGCIDQVNFIRNKIIGLLALSYEEFEVLRSNIQVISTHTSKSVILPVYQISLQDGMVIITMRNNFYDWKVSIDSKQEIETDFMEIFDPTEKISGCFCEGFPKHLVFGSYEENKSQFTCEIGNDYELYMFFYILARQMRKE